MLTKIIIFLSKIVKTVLKNKFTYIYVSQFVIFDNN